jgi:hypothetical protein
MSEPRPGQIRRNDPSRAHLHDYWLVDAATGEDLAGFANEATALAYLNQHHWRRGKVTILATVHPDGCDCPDAPAVDSAGRRRR